MKGGGRAERADETVCQLKHWFSMLLRDYEVSKGPDPTTLTPQKTEGEHRRTVREREKEKKKTYAALTEQKEHRNQSFHSDETENRQMKK